jgi:F-type H+-transporting ATPase subunit a
MEELKSFPTWILKEFFGLDVSDYLVMLALIMVFSIVVLFILTRKLSVEKPGMVQHSLEFIVQSLDNLLTEVIGKHGKDYLPVVGTFGVLIFLCNLSGFIPGFMPPTSHLVVTLSLGLCSFIMYNLVGLAKGGFSYLKHFLGPMSALAVLFLPIELVSHCSRPISLGIRLFCNIFGDHQVGNIFLRLVPIGVPVPFILLGLFVAFMQTFVFVILSSVYISMALPHDETEHSE